MNKILLVLGVVLILSSTVSFAQSNAIRIGIEGGPNRSSFWGNDFAEKGGYTKKAINFSSGVSFEYHFTDLLSFRSGLAFERKGVTFQVQQIDESRTKFGTATGRSTYDYLTLPLLAKITLGDNPVFFVNAGPYLGYLLKQTNIIEDSDIQPGSREDRTGDNRKLDLGITTGLGAGVKVTDKVLVTMELRYNLGLYNISAVPVYNNGEVRTKSANLLIGIAHRIRD
ncbi:porin family protein [uncultured Pontibacter sp.]|uniref:porin family protein n=1 Tax=uncultured Pontibacter sp. TaxID=453356 RepID=UPI002611700B|nr:porin family protein [uncultured Pontibacter sp.]